MSESDIVTIHVPLTESTKLLVGKKEISMMKKTAILINTARGKIVDNDALADALIKGKIAGAGIDVFDAEPPLEKSYKLLSAPNTLLLPHIGYATKEAVERRNKIVVENVKKYMEGKIENRVV